MVDSFRDFKGFREDGLYNERSQAGARFANSALKNYAERELGKQANHQSFAGTDIQAFMYMPLYTKGSAAAGTKGGPSKQFGTLQTMSISSTRSVSPVRTLGRASPVAYTRGARTIAGTLVFATINQDVFADVYDVAIGETAQSASTSLLSDQMPPFSIVLTAGNEKGAVATQIIHGITLVNYGTTYSIDDLYTETTYTYVATDIMPLLSRQVNRGLTRYQQAEKALVQKALDVGPEYFKSLSTKIQDSMKTAYGTAENWWSNVKYLVAKKQAEDDFVELSTSGLLVKT